MNFDFFDAGVFQFNVEQLRALFPFLALCLGMVFTTIASASRFPVAAHKLILFITFFAFGVAMAAGLGSAETLLFGGSLVVDDTLRWIAIGLSSLALLALLAIYDVDHSEWSTLLLVSVLGMTLLPGARDWICFFLFLETMAIPGYVMAAFRQKRDGGYEAGLKYLLMGAFASALLLMGSTLLFGATGSFEYATIHDVLRFGIPSNMTIAAVILIVVSAGFKVAMAPLHMWAADVYQSAPSSLAAFMAGAGKLSVFSAVLIAWSKSGFFQLDFVPGFVLVLGVLSILIGNLMALSQKSLRRMLAYSSVASAGYVAIVLPVGEAALPSIFVYLVTYGAALAAVFAVIESLSVKSGKSSSANFTLSDLALVPYGTAKKETFILTLALFSMAGIPPLPGFLGKYLILGDVWSHSPYSALWILLGSLMGLAYYLRILVPLYFEKGPSSTTTPIKRLIPQTVMASAVIGVVGLFVWIWVYSVYFVPAASETMLGTLR